MAASRKRERVEQTSHKVIEKRRRDRINNCLFELSQTVPAAFSKQSSGKLEKAEILEMTVEYLRAVQSTEIGLRFDNGEWFSADIWGDFAGHFQTGYSDCVREVVKYMADVEGIPASDSRCVRLVSFLHNRFRSDSANTPGTGNRSGTGSGAGTGSGSGTGNKVETGSPNHLLPQAPTTAYMVSRPGFFADCTGVVVPAPSHRETRVGASMLNSAMVKTVSSSAGGGEAGGGMASSLYEASRLLPFSPYLPPAIGSRASDLHRAPPPPPSLPSVAGGGVVPVHSSLVAGGVSSSPFRPLPVQPISAPMTSAVDLLRRQSVSSRDLTAFSAVSGSAGGVADRSHRDLLFSTDLHAHPHHAGLGMSAAAIIKGACTTI